MNPGVQSKRLTAEQIERLKWFRRHAGRNGYSFPQLKLAMDAPFTWQTLKRAIEGSPVAEFNHDFIVEWLDRFVPAKPGPKIRDYKADAAGDHTQEPNDNGETLDGPAHPARLRGDRGSEER